MSIGCRVRQNYAKEAYLIYVLYTSRLETAQTKHGQKYTTYG